MNTETDTAKPFSLKRLVLVMLTILVSVVMGQSLISSWNQPQVASRLQLYQTDLLLQGSAWQAEFLSEEQRAAVRSGLIGNDPVQSALEQYQEVRQTAASAIARSQAQIQELDLPSATEEGKPLSRRLQASVSQQQALLSELDLRIGLLKANQGETATAVSQWQQVQAQSLPASDKGQTAAALIQLWQDQAPATTAEQQLTQNLEGWFRYRALEKLYQTEGELEQEATLLTQEQSEAERQLVKLALVGTVPALGAVLGTGLLIGLLVQRLTRGNESLLLQNAGRGWDITWNGEIIWQVLIVGFFFVGQIALPLLLGSLGLGFATFSSRARAFYSMAYYLLMAASGIGVLIWSLRPYRPLPADLFRFELKGRWWLWGLGGYLVALPLMLGVSLLNQQIWQGQGGSNPLLQTVLEEQDPVALLVFLLTAAIAAPLFEEVLFRGFLLPSLTRYLPVWGAIGLSALIFAAAHLSLSEVLPLTLLGVILGFVYTRSRNLLAPILLHSAWNSVTMLGLFILGSR
ncbi:CPBP family glutamic-type intramembrane protease [Pseudanabaena sp. FACHB-2040]|uniref:CPBP family intramembrane glutamic endopeptidase n=1 Tax=Pseudanabaena sp. FACHB-2040 TaxID=2692859 RepID=UPI0016855C67|nr:CPBP family glutamic-type intramembrane protease [Pseudanabaena sp. FACHB-2040]MBD2259934.1 CPBP family intramembrane metalloprotease [Pseudanabaena sp. FACHB-2040]